MQSVSHFIAGEREWFLWELSTLSYEKKVLEIISKKALMANKTEDDSIPSLSKIKGSMGPHWQNW